MTRRISPSYGFLDHLMPMFGPTHDRRNRRVDPGDWRPGRGRPCVTAPEKDLHGK